MRYFFNVDGIAILSTLASMSVPGDGGEDGVTVPDGFVEVTEEQYQAYESAPRSTFVDGALVAPAPLLPVIDKATFALLFSRAERDAIRAYRRANPDDDDIEDLYYFLDRIDRIDLNVPNVLTMMTAGLGLLVSKGLLTGQEAARIAAGTPPA